MSEQINNREYRKQVIKQVISELHAGKSLEEVKQKFEDAFTGVSAAEISEAEQALISEGLPVSEVQRLCDVHAAVFKGSIEEIHQSADQTEILGHPANVLKLENRQLEKIIDDELDLNIDNLIDNEAVKKIRTGLEKLSIIDLHYSKKENLLFPYMEKYGITAPPKVMWGVDDEIRLSLKTIKNNLSAGSYNELKQDINGLINKITEMIFKEENIMLPMLLETMTQDEWKQVADDSYEIGFIIENIPKWKPDLNKKEEMSELKEEKSEIGVISMPSGVLKTEELIAMLNTFPFDITFVGKDDKVKYFSQGTERIFPRTKTIIGREVSNCHPPASVHIVEGIVADLKSGIKDHEDFWIKMGDKFIYIRYFAVRDQKGEYLGVLEVTQNINNIQKISGEKRLVSE